MKSESILNPKKPVRILLLVLFILYAGMVFKNYYQYYPVHPGYIWHTLIASLSIGKYVIYSLSNLGQILSGIFFLVLSSLFGLFFVKCFNFPQRETQTEHFVVLFGVGSVLTSYLLMGLGLTGIIGFNYLPNVVTLLLLIVLLSYKLLRFPGEPENITSHKERIKKFVSPLNLLNVLLLLGSLLIALNPVTESDALRYHVALSEKMFQQGGLYYYPFNTFFQFPSLFEMNFDILHPAMSNHNPRIIHWCYLLLSYLLLGVLVRKHFKDLNARFLQLIFLSIPFIPIIGGWAFIELGLTFYVMLAVYLILEIRAAEKIHPSHWILLGILCGALVAMKYSMMTLIPMLIALPVFYTYQKTGWSFKPIVWMLVFMVLFSAPWFVRNYVNTGNPVYPMGYSLFGGDYWSEQNSGYYFKHAQAKGGLTESKQENIFYQIADWCYVPVKASLNPPTYALRDARSQSWLYHLTENRIFLPDNFGDWQLSPLFLIFFPVLILGLWNSPELRREKWNSIAAGLLLLIGWYYLSWVNSYRDNRFLLPILPFLVILLGIAVQQVSSKVVVGILVLLVGYNLVWTSQTVLREHNPLPYVLGKVNTDQYLSAKLDYYSTYQKWNHLKKDKDALLLVGEYRPLYLEGNYYCADFFDTPVLLRLLNGIQTRQELNARLLEMRIDYILYNPNELSRYLPEYLRHFNPNINIDLYRELIHEIETKAQTQITIDRPVSEQELQYYREFNQSPDAVPNKIYLYKF